MVFEDPCEVLEQRQEPRDLILGLCPWFLVWGRCCFQIFKTWKRNPKGIDFTSALGCTSDILNRHLFWLLGWDPLCLSFTECSASFCLWTHLSQPWSQWSSGQRSQFSYLKMISQSHQREPSGIRHSLPLPLQCLGHECQIHLFHMT